MLGQALIGRIADKCLSRRYKTTVIVALITMLLSAAAFTACFPISDDAGETKAGGPSRALVWALALLCGLGMGAMNPISYEVGVEMTYPTHESASASVVALIVNLLTLAFLAITPIIPIRLWNMLQTGSLLLAIPLMASASVTYKRLDAENANRATTAPTAATSLLSAA